MRAGSPVILMVVTSVLWQGRNELVKARRFEQIESYRQMYSEGTRIELDWTDDPAGALKVGDRGTVLFVDDGGHLNIRWDRGIILNLVPGHDRFRAI